MLVWDTDSLSRHGVELGLNRLTRSDPFEGDGAHWKLRTRLRNVENSDAPLHLAVEMFLLDEQGGIVESRAEPTRPGLVGARGVANANLLAITDSDDETTQVSKVFARVRHGGPHFEDPSLPLPVSVDQAHLAESGIELESLRATCSSSRWGATIEVTVALRAQVENAPPELLNLWALDDLGVPVDGDLHILELASDPDHRGMYFDALTWVVPVVPSRIVLATSGRYADDTSFPSGPSTSRLVLPDVPDEQFLADVEAEMLTDADLDADLDWPALSHEEIAQLEKLASRVADLNPVITVDTTDAEIVIEFDAESNLGAYVSDGHFGFSTTFTRADGTGPAVAWGHVPMTDVQEAENEVRQTFKDMPRLKREALDDE